ncbi:MAG: GNAT family N-acetyltransferase [Flavobacteriales bacterium]|nr:GNAT family N-acetyltransferase [Flavobacteriales bacterium]
MISITLSTDRLLLKGISSENMFDIFNQLPEDEIKTLLGHRTHESFLKEKQKHLDGYSSYNRRFMMFLLIHEPSGLVIGRCGIHNWNKENQRAEIGYVMEDENYKRQGLMSEAVKAILSYGFHHLNLNRIDALVGTGNIPSIKILNSNGFIQEGLLRQHVRGANGFEDSLLFSLLKQEFDRV